MIDSLVRVSRRVVQGQIWKKVWKIEFLQETMQPKSHALTTVLFNPTHQLPPEMHHTAISHRRLPSVHSVLSRDRFPFNNFTCYLTPFSRCFSSFPHGTCSLSVSCQYLALDGIYHPFELHSQATRLFDKLVVQSNVSRRDCHPLWCFIPEDLNTSFYHSKLS